MEWTKLLDNNKHEHHYIIWSRSEVTGSVREVLMYHGAIALVRMLSLAHSQAKFLASWFIAADTHMK